MTLMWNSDTSAWHDLILVDASKVLEASEALGSDESDRVSTPSVDDPRSPERPDRKQGTPTRPKLVREWSAVQCRQIHAASWTPFLWGMTSRCGDRAHPGRFRLPGAANSVAGCEREGGVGPSGARGSAIDGDVITAMCLSGLAMEGGLATTLVDTGQQWDFPNSWPPLLCTWVDGLMSHAENHAAGCSGVAGESGEGYSCSCSLAGGGVGAPCGRCTAASARGLASHLARAFLGAVQTGLDKTGYVWEKYDAREVGKCGGGGEYDVQTGFGWTNGVALHLMRRWGFSPL
jgi:hypothetical protein